VRGVKKSRCSQEKERTNTTERKRELFSTWNKKGENTRNVGKLREETACDSAEKVKGEKKRGGLSSRALVGLTGGVAQARIATRLRTVIRRGSRPRKGPYT